MITFVWGLTKVIFLGFALSVLLRQSYNIIFFVLKQPLLWSVFVGMMGLLFWALGYLLSQSIDIMFYSSVLCLIANIPPEVKQISADQLDNWSDEFAGIKRSRVKYRIGLAVFTLGCVAGWILFWGEIGNVRIIDSIL